MSRILFLLEDYNLFYSIAASANIKKGGNYHESLNLLINHKYYQSDSMAAACSNLGYETRVVVPECNPLQLRWAYENSPFLYLKWQLGRPVRSIKSRVLKRHRTSYNYIHFQVLLQQIQEFKPDYVYFYSNVYITANQIKTLKLHCRKIILQWTCPLYDEKFKFPYSSFDLIITASLQLVEYFNGMNIKVRYLQQAFDSRIIDNLLPVKELKGDVVFIGGFSLGHEYRAEVLQYLLESGIEIIIHGTGKEYLSDFPLLRNSMKDAIFGNDLYNEYRKYKMAIHIHTTGREGDGIDWNKYAGAKRLFEITGAGTLLLTSWQENIPDLFVEGEEVIVFKDKEDLLKKITYLLSREDDIRKISYAGQQRTIKEHSFIERAKMLSEYLKELG